MVQRAAQEEGIVFLMPHNVKQEEDGHSLSILEIYCTVVQCRTQVEKGHSLSGVLVLVLSH